MDPFTCDYCDQPLRKDVNGWWVGPDKTSDCPVHPGGHEFDGSAR